MFAVVVNYPLLAVGTCFLWMLESLLGNTFENCSFINEFTTQEQKSWLIIDILVTIRPIN